MNLASLRSVILAKMKRSTYWSLNPQGLTLNFQSQLCIEDCQNFDGEELKSKYLSNLSETGLAEFRAAKGTAQDKLWNDALCSTKYFANYSVDYWSQHVEEKEWVMSCSDQMSSMNRLKKTIKLLKKIVFN